MVAIEKIEGQRILRLFKELQKEGTFLKLSLPNNNYEHLTGIVDIQTQKKNSYILIDYADGFQDAVLDSNAASINFEFTGKDEIKYFFQTNSWQIIQEKIWLELPHTVEREQRRRQFRISAPAGAKIFFNLNNRRYELKLIDISLGGSLGVLGGAPGGAGQDQKPLRVKHLQNVELIFPRGDENVRVIINQCEVKRLGRNPVTNQYEYGLEFLEIDKSNSKTLNDLVFTFQREFLRKRLRINA